MLHDTFSQHQPTDDISLQQPPRSSSPAVTTVKADESNTSTMLKAKARREQKLAQPPAPQLKVLERKLKKMLRVGFQEQAL